MKIRQKNHGDCGTKLYNSWRAMKQRCYDKSQQKHNSTYTGVTVCDDWMRYAPFRDWALKNGYKDGLTIDRIDSKGNYTPNNCQWITRSENSRRRNSEYDYSKRKVVGRIIETIDGEYMTVKEYSDKNNLVYNSFRASLRNKPLLVNEKEL